MTKPHTKEAPPGFGSPKDLAASRQNWGPYPKPNPLPTPRWLRHLPHTKQGYAVPWVSDWTGTGDCVKRWQPVPGFPEWGDFHDDSAGYGIGNPIPARLGVSRQVLGMVKRLCGVCGRGILPAEQPVGIGGKDITHHGLREPLVHERCAVYALQVCPGINHGRVFVWQGAHHDFVLTPLYFDGRQQHWQQRPFGARGPKLPVQFVVAIPKFEPVTAFDWLRAHDAQPHPALGGAEARCPWTPKDDRGDEG